MLDIKFVFFILLTVNVSLSQSTILENKIESDTSPIVHFAHTTFNALSHPLTLIPLALAAGIYITHSDTRITDWAVTKHHVYGTQDNAKRASDILQNASAAVYGVTFMINILLHKNRGLGSLYDAGGDLSSVAATIITTEILKSGTGRNRPDRSDSRSFPSGHTSFTSVNMTLSADNIDNSGIPVTAAGSIKCALLIYAAATAWGRIEGRKHYASDVLAGAAIGHFAGRIITDFYTSKHKNRCMNINIEPENYEVGLTLYF